MPQARKATSTTAANGFDDHEPNDDTTAVRYRVEVLARHHRSRGRGGRAWRRQRSGSRARRRSAGRSRSPWARGARRRGSPRRRPTQASKPMNTQPPTASAASSPAASEPPDSASAPRVSVRIDRSCVAEDEQQGEADAHGGDDLGGDPGLHRPAQDADARARRPSAQTTTSTMPVTTIAFGVGLDPEQRERPRRAEVGDRRVGHGVGADRDPAREPAVGGRPSAGAPLVGAAGDRELGRQLGVDGEQQALTGERDRQHPHPGGPATSVPTSTTAYSPTTGEMAGEARAPRCPEKRRRRSSSCR